MALVGQRRRDHLQDAPGPRRHHDDARRQVRGLGDRVGDEDDGALLAPPELLQLLVEAVARDLVERAEGLVHHQQARLEAERARDRDALLHAARELPRVLPLEAGQADALELLHRHRLARGRVAALDLQRQHDVGEHRAPWKERRRLEDVAVGAGQARLVRAHAVDLDRARGDRLEVGDDAQQRRLAAARRADERDELAGRDRQVDLAQRMHRRVGRGIDDAHACAQTPRARAPTRRRATDAACDRGRSSRRSEGARRRVGTEPNGQLIVAVHRRASQLHASGAGRMALRANPVACWHGGCVRSARVLTKRSASAPSQRRDELHGRDRCPRGRRRRPTSAPAAATPPATRPPSPTRRRASRARRRWSRPSAASTASTRPACTPARPASTCRASSAASATTTCAVRHAPSSSRIRSAARAPASARPRSCASRSACKVAQEGKPVEIGRLQRYAVDAVMDRPVTRALRARRRHGQAHRRRRRRPGRAGLRVRPRAARPRGRDPRREAARRRPQRIRPRDATRWPATSPRPRSPGCSRSAASRSSSAGISTAARSSHRSATASMRCISPSA